jgi:4a-hydroxytetrahydrobiopterin dehydratase
METAPRFAEGSDEAALVTKLSPLLSSAGGKWSLTASGDGLERSFKFKTFAKTWDFMTAVSLQCKIRNHHPEWSNVRCHLPL